MWSLVVVLLVLFTGSFSRLSPIHLLNFFVSAFDFLFFNLQRCNLDAPFYRRRLNHGFAFIVVI
jgi:hypothetical protein